MTIEELYKDFKSKLKNIYDEREALNITNWVFENITGFKRWDILKGKENKIDNSAIRQLDNKLNELLLYKPVQYVLEEAWFYKMRFFVNEHVLIPRPETEELVEWVTKKARIKNKELRILDIGTGSGCIAIALKKELPSSQMLAIDISKDALKVAVKNASDHQVEIEFIELDFLDELSWNQLPEFDIIASNPPYIPESGVLKLNKNVADFEPSQALFVKDDDPLIFYKKTATFCRKHLRERGKIFVEINEEFGKEVKEIFDQHTYKSSIKKDMYGKERMIYAWK